MNTNKIGWVITALERLSALKTYDLDHCELGFIHANERENLLGLLPSLSCTVGIHFPLFRFGDTIPPSTEYALLDFNDQRSEFLFTNLENDLKAARSIHAQYVLVHLQRFFRLFGEKLSMAEKKFWELTEKKGDRLLKLQQKYGIPVVLEAICGCDFFHTAEHLQTFMTRFPQFRYCIDISHLQIDKWIYDIDPVKFINTLKNNVSHLHLNNFKIPADTIPFTRFNFFQYYKKSPINLFHSRKPGYADINAILNCTLTENTCEYYVFEQYLPDPDDPSAAGIHEVINKIRQCS